MEARGINAAYLEAQLLVPRYEHHARLGALIAELSAAGVFVGLLFGAHPWAELANHWEPLQICADAALFANQLSATFPCPTSAPSPAPSLAPPGGPIDNSVTVCATGRRGRRGDTTGQCVAKKCSGGSLVSRGPSNGCKFRPCPEEPAPSPTGAPG